MLTITYQLQVCINSLLGTLPPRPKGNPLASHANAVRMPIFELLQIIFHSVSNKLIYQM